jgi:hypothetical protein
MAKIYKEIKSILKNNKKRREVERSGLMLRLFVNILKTPLKEKYQTIMPKIEQLIFKMKGSDLGLKATGSIEIIPEQ